MPGLAYTTEVNKGSVNMRWLTGHLNEMAQQGWRLHTIFEQDRNTVIIFERRHAVAAPRTWRNAEGRKECRDIDGHRGRAGAGSGRRGPVQIPRLAGGTSCCGSRTPSARTASP